MLETHEFDKLSHTVCKLNTSSGMLAYVTISMMTDYEASGKRIIHGKKEETQSWDKAIRCIYTSCFLISSKYVYFNMKFLLKAKKLSFIVSFIISIKISIKIFYNIYKSGECKIHYTFSWILGKIYYKIKRSKCDILNNCFNFLKK